MILNLGRVRPGSTIRIPFNTYDKDDGSSITMTNYTQGADIWVYKNGSTTERNSAMGFGATTDFDGKTGKHFCIIDLADNSVAGFYAAGCEYHVMIHEVTVDAVTVGGFIARFEIGYDGSILDTTIATLASQTSFTLTEGPAEADALNGHWAIIHDVASKVQFSRVLILDYDVTTKTVTLAAGATFTVAATDNFSVMGMAPMQPVILGSNPVVTSGVISANVAQINADATAAANLALSAAGICTGTVTTGATTISIPTSVFSPSGAVADQFKGRILIFRRDTTTTALRGQATDILASSNSATPTLTVTALTTAPVSGDTFVVV